MKPVVVLIIIIAVGFLCNKGLKKAGFKQPPSVAGYMKEGDSFAQASRKYVTWYLKTYFKGILVGLSIVGVLGGATVEESSCPYCGGDVDSNDEYCPHCGKILS